MNELGCYPPRQRLQDPQQKREKNHLTDSRIIVADVWTRYSCYCSYYEILWNMLFANLGVSWTIAIAVISSNPMSLMILAASRTLVYHVYNRIYIIIYRNTGKETVWDTGHPSYPNTDGQGTHGESVSCIFCVWSLITIEVTVQATPFMSKDRCAAAAFKAGGVRVTGKQLRMMSFISKIKIPHVVIYCRWCRYRVLETDDGLCWCSIIFPLYKQTKHFWELYL